MLRAEGAKSQNENPAFLAKGTSVARGVPQKVTP
jgi:hypothetical protein